MPDQTTRNTLLLSEIIQVLSDWLPDKEAALARLEDHFQNTFILIAGNIEFVATAAESLRLAIITDECPAVLDYIAQKSIVGITVEDVDEAINELFDDRFIEP